MQDPQKHKSPVISWMITGLLIYRLVVCEQNTERLELRSTDRMSASWYLIWHRILAVRGRITRHVMQKPHRRLAVPYNINGASCYFNTELLRHYVRRWLVLLRSSRWDPVEHSRYRRPKLVCCFEGGSESFARLTSQALRSQSSCTIRTLRLFAHRLLVLEQNLLLRRSSSQRIFGKSFRKSIFELLLACSVNTLYSKKVKEVKVCESKF